MRKQRLSPHPGSSPDDAAKLLEVMGRITREKVEIANFPRDIRSRRIGGNHPLESMHLLLNGANGPVRFCQVQPISSRVRVQGHG